LREPSQVWFLAAAKTVGALNLFITGSSQLVSDGLAVGWALWAEKAGQLAEQGARCVPEQVCTGNLRKAGGGRSLHGYMMSSSHDLLVQLRF
jgi:hypothetical protein